MVGTAHGMIRLKRRNFQPQGMRMDQLGDGQPQDQFQAHRDDREVQRAPDRFPEGLILQHVEIVAQPDKGPRLVDAGRRVIKAQDETWR